MDVYKFIQIFIPSGIRVHGNFLEIPSVHIILGDYGGGPSLFLLYFPLCYVVYGEYFQPPDTATSLGYWVG